MILYQVTKKFEDISRQKVGQCMSYGQKDYVIFEEKPNIETINHYGLINKVVGTVAEILNSVKKPVYSPDDRKVMVYLRVKDSNNPMSMLTGGAVYGAISVKTEADYLFDHKGLKIVGHETFDNTYKISEVISGAEICESSTKEEATEVAKQLLNERMPDEYIKKIKLMAPFYGMSCLMTSAVHVIRDNTLMGHTRDIKKYNRRTRGEKYEFGSKYKK